MHPGGAAARDAMSPQALRSFIDLQVGGIDRLKVPSNNAELPQPLRADGTPDPFFETTEAKRYLGKQLFHDPVLTVRIMSNFGGVPATAKTASCGSCHNGRTASKSGTLLNFGVGGEGIGYTDANAKFIPRRRPNTDILPALRTTALFPGDELVDELPTFTDVFQFAIGSPARGRKLPDPGTLLATGRLDALDSVARNSGSVLGAAFNNRLMADGFAGEPDASPGGLNPFGHPAQENLALIQADAHRMLDFQSAELQKIPAYVQLFRTAFPAEAAQADAAEDMNLLINDVTVLRAIASFMRTVVTRNTPWDRFLAGNNAVLTPPQRRGAELFFTDATDGTGGAGCFSCHSGPMLNKQPGDPDVSGVGQFVEENFFNLGLADHPLQALNRFARNDPNFRDEGRSEITGNVDDVFKFRTLTLRQLKDGRVFMHNGSFRSVLAVVKYFNAGVPQDVEAGGAATMSTRFTNPRGGGTLPGLGLSSRNVSDLTDFIENALYDPAFAEYNAKSTTDSFQLNERDLAYSAFRPELAALGAVDGRVLSGRPQDNDDPLSRRDLGLEFLDVTDRVAVSSTRSGDVRRPSDQLKITNTGASVVDTHMHIVVQGLGDGVRLVNASGTTSGGEPFVRMFLDGGVLLPGQSINQRLNFAGRNDQPVTYALMILSGQGKP